MLLRTSGRSILPAAIVTAASALLLLGVLVAPGAAAPLRVQLPAVTATPPAEPPDPAVEAWVEETLASLTLRERVAQLVLPWIPGGTIAQGTPRYAELRRWIEDERVGGLIVSRGAVGEFARMMNHLQELSAVPLLIVSDLETGPAMRLTGGTNIPPAMALGASGREDLAREAGRITGIEARRAGIHVTLGPVLDVNSNPFNPIINTRSFGEDPGHVGRMAAAWIEGAREEGLLTVGKHFPGHGATEVDSHIGLPTLGVDRQTLETVDLAPFLYAAGRGMDGVLVGHIAVPAIDGEGAPPASLSPAIVGGILRERMGFDGVVITDALNMGGVTEHYPVAEASILAILAGADLLLQPPGTSEVIRRVVEAVESGRISPERIDASVRRVLRAKAAAGLHRPGGAQAAGGAAPAAHGRLATEIAEASITLARDDDGLVPLPAGARRIVHIAYSTAETGFSAPRFTERLRAGGKQVEEIRVNERSGRAALEDAARRGRAAELVIVSANLVPREYRGRLALESGFSELVEGLIAAEVPVVAVSFGSPYLLDSFPSVSSYLLAWSGSAAPQQAAARALLGEIPITARLPVSLPPFHTIGEGLTRD